MASGLGRHHRRTAVAADVDDRPQAAVGLADDDQGHATDDRRLMVAGVRQGGAQGEEDGSVAEQELPLALEAGLIGVGGGGTHRAVVGVQAAEVLAGGSHPLQ